MAERDVALSIKVSVEEREMLRALADRDGLSASDVVRVFIRRAHAEAFGTKPKKATKPKA